MADKLITDLQELSGVTEDTYVPVRNATAGTRKYNLKSLIDTVVTAVQSATAAAAEAMSAGQRAESAANAAAEDANDASERAEAAIRAIGDISELAVPLISGQTMGGAMLGRGLKVEGKALSLGDMITDETNGPIYSADAKGWSEQETTTGKNLKKPTVRTATASGVTYSVAEDGKITLTGTATQGDNFTIYLSQTFDAGTYTASLHGSDKAVFANDSSVRTVTDPSVSSFYIRVKEGTTYNESFYVQLESGSTATSYEPYTGGKPSPSPDYPQEVRVARGRNLLNFNAPRKTGDFSAQTRNMDGNGVWVGITANNYYNNSRIQNLTESDGVTTFTCIQAGYGIGIEAAVAPNTEYAWSAVHNENTQVSFGFYTSGGSYIGMSSISSSGSGVITTPSDCAYMTMVLRAKSDGVSCEYRQVQLELGSTPMPYVPYGHVGLEVQGRNLWDEEWELGIYAYARQGEKAVSTNQIRCANKTPIQPSTDYYVRIPYTPTTSGFAIALFYDGNGDYLSEYKQITSNGYIITTPSNAHFMTFYLSAFYGTTYKHDICINVSDPGFDGQYEPYTHTTTPIPLPVKGFAAALSDGTADTLAIDSAGRCDWESGIALYTVTGNETISGSNQYGDYRRIYFALNKGTGFSATDLKPILCTKCPYAYDPGGQFVHGYVNGDSVILFNVGTAATDVLASYAGAEIFYELKNHTTEHAYIDLPTIPEGAVIDIPELREVGVKCFVHGVSELVDHANNWGERCKQNESRIAALEAAIADLA